MRKICIAVVCLVCLMVPVYAWAEAGMPDEGSNEEVEYYPDEVAPDEATPGGVKAGDTEQGEDPADGKEWSQDGNFYVLDGVTYDKEDNAVTGIATIDGVTYCFENGIKVTGFVEAENGIYYFGSDGVMTTGFKTIGGAKYYFGTNGVMVTGFKKIGGSKYYFYDTGKMAKGLKTIGGSRYYFTKAGKMKTGVVRTGGKLYFFEKSGKGRAKKGWFKGTDGKKRYCLGKGRIASGVKKVGKTWYFFRIKSGTLQKKGFFKYKKKEYYSKGGGKLATGWKAIGKKACYFYPDGKKPCSMAKNTKVGYLKVPKSGRLGEAYVLGIKALDKHGWTLRSAYTFSYRLKYYDRWYRTSSSEKYSLRGFKAHHGNCYVMAATFYIQAKLLGYDIHQVRGHVGIWPHSWTVIRHGKKYFVYDPNFRNETGRNGWKIWYGKSGTWRYSGRHWMN